jgi:hypothetical protein
MTTYNTGNPLGSVDVKDLYDNAENLDVLVNTQTELTNPDRFGVARKTWKGMETEFVDSQADKEDRFQEFLADSAYQPIGAYAAGIEVTAYNQVILADGEYWRLSASTPLPYTTTGAGMPEGGSFVGVGDAVLRQDLADPAKGSELVAYQPAGTGAVPTDVQSKLRESVSVKDFGAVGDGVTDDTSAFTAAQAAHEHIRVPPGLNCKVNSGLDYWKFYGEGAVFEPNRQWTLNPFPQTGGMSKTYNPRTFGTYETAVANSVTANSSPATGQRITNTQVLGTNAQGLAQVYTLRDHVAQFAMINRFTPDVLDASTSYTATTVTNAAISGLNVKPGMVIDTQHSLKFTGIVRSVSGTTITVDAWWPATPNGAPPGTPANGVGAIINPNSKLYGQNIVVGGGGNNTTTGARDITGVELNMFTGASSSPVLNTWGYDMTSFGGGYLDVGYQIRGPRNISYFSRPEGGNGQFGFYSKGDNRGLRIEDPVQNAIELIVGGQSRFALQPTGTMFMRSGRLRHIGPQQTTGSFVSIGDAWTTGYGALFYITGFNVANGQEGKFLLAANNTSTGVIYNSDGSGTTVQFQISANTLQIRATTGTFQFSAFQLMAN